jgi:hypothetical protein
MWLSDVYDIPQEVVDAPHSPAFREFLLTWFGSSRRIYFGLPDLTVLKDLTPEEITLAQQLVRRNLKCRYIHIINATWALRDTSTAPLLRMMLEEEPEESRALTIAGALWKLVRDPVFIQYLERAMGTGLITAHINQVLWLDDGRALDFLIDLLPEEDEDERKAGLIRRRNILSHTPFRRMANRMITNHNQAQGAGPWALGLLNHLEFGQGIPLDQQHPPSHYRRYRSEPVFREHMLQAIQKSNKAPNLDW